MPGGVLALLVLVGGTPLRRSSEANVGFNRPEPYEACAQPASRARSF